MTTHEHDQPLVSIDVVPVRFTGKRFEVALGKRKFDPFLGELALPGVLLGSAERIREASHRALTAKVGIAEDTVHALVQVGAFDNSDRDPRGPTIAISSFAVVDPNPKHEIEGTWFPVDGLPALPFDHDKIIASAMNELGLRLWRDQVTTRAVLGHEFATSRAIAATEALLSEGVDKTNFTRTLKGYGFLEQAGTINTGRGRPSRGWRFA